MKKAETVTKHLKPSAKPSRYFEAVGRRKTAIARVRVFGTGGEKEGVVVNGKPVQEYFPLKKQRMVVEAPFQTLSLTPYHTSVKVKGGGVSAQAEAVRLGISRALILLNPDWRPKLKALGFLMRDPRKVERKKFGSRKARRPQQWRKR